MIMFQKKFLIQADLKQFHFKEISRTHKILILRKFRQLLILKCSKKMKNRKRKKAGLISILMIKAMFKAFQKSLINFKKIEKEKVVF